MKCLTRLFQGLKSLKSKLEPDLNCDFEHGLCNWIQDVSRDTSNWTRSFNQTEVQRSYIQSGNMDFKTGPQQADSHYIYLNSFDKTHPLTNAILISPEVFVDETKKFCLEFKYHMLAIPEHINNGPSIGTLSVKIRVTRYFFFYCVANLVNISKIFKIYRVFSKINFS